MIKYSIVIPVFNSEASLDELVERIHTTIVPLNVGFELICVNDSSTDGSWDKLKFLKGQFSETLKIISLAKNFGQHSALFCGFTYASGEFIITIDDDLQHQPEDIILLIDEIEKGKNELVYGMGKEKKSAFRKFVSWLWNFLTRHIDNGIGRGSAFKIINKRIKNAVIKHPQGIIFLDEIIQWHTDKVGFVNVEHKARKYGKSNYSPLTLFSFITKVSFNYSTVPLKLMAILGACISFFSSMFCLILVFKKFYSNIEIRESSIMVIVILFSLGLLLIGMGLIGRYLNQIFILLNNKPSFSVNEEIL